MTEQWRTLADGREVRVDSTKIRPSSGPLPSALTPLTKTYVVDKAFGSPLPSGSIGAPFATVTAGIAALIAAAGDDGGTLLIVGGDYSAEPAITLPLGGWCFRAWTPPGGTPAPVFLPKLEVDDAAGATIVVDDCSYGAGIETIQGTTYLRARGSGGTLTDTANTLTAELFGNGPGALQPIVTGSCLNLRAVGMKFSPSFTVGDATTPVELEHCLIADTMGSLGPSGGTHINQPWRLIDCQFQAGAELAALAPGASFDVYFDDASIASFWKASGVRTGNVQFYQDSALPPFLVEANANTNTSTTGADTNWHAITGPAFAAGAAAPYGGSSPWLLTAEGCVVTYGIAYAGLGAVGSPRFLVRATVRASVSTVAAATVALAIDLGDLIGTAVGYAAPGLATVSTPTPIATGFVQITTVRYIQLDARTLATMQPVFGCLDGEDVLIENLSFDLEPVSLIQAGN